MKILVTGAQGFIAKNLISTLNNIRLGKDRSFEITDEITIYECNHNTEESLLEAYCKDCDFVFNLAGVNRPKNENEFMEGNCSFVNKLVGLLKQNNNFCPIMLSSSKQAECQNVYGESKRAGEKIIRSYGQETGAPVYIYRLPNVFGKWCRPNYNSVVATFCYNISHNLPIQVNDSNKKIELVYIDDVIKELVSILSHKEHVNECGFGYIPIKYTISLGDLATLIHSFYKSREIKTIPDMTRDSISTKLYATYLSYLPENDFNYPLRMNKDDRGSFTEILRTSDRGQVSVNISRPGITKGEHWHHTKNEKFVVVSGEGLIQLRRIDSDKVISYHVSGEKIEVIDIPTGYTHNIKNTGTNDLVTVMWCSECFDPNHPDTYALQVNKEEQHE